MNALQAHFKGPSLHTVHAANHALGQQLVLFVVLDDDDLEQVGAEPSTATRGPHDALHCLQRP